MVIGGVRALQQQFDVRFMQPPPGANHTEYVRSKRLTRFIYRNWIWSLTALSLPGHTVNTSAITLPACCFVGDTVCRSGCVGYLMARHSNLPLIAKLANAAARIPAYYCGHEYTLSISRFALTVNPTIGYCNYKIGAIRHRAILQHPTLPTTLRRNSRNPSLPEM